MNEKLIQAAINIATKIGNATDIKQNCKRYIVYRHGNTEAPDEIIETDISIQDELVNKLRSDPTITRVDLQILQIFTWSNYISIAKDLESIAGEVHMPD